MLRRIAYLSAFLALAAIGLLFTALNPQRFDIDIGLTRFGISAGLALLIAYSAGLLMGAAWRSDWISPPSALLRLRSPVPRRSRFFKRWRKP